jgi:protein gp37
MGDNSAIEWTDATWNPVTGCTKIGRGCDNCYAERFSERFRGVAGHPFERTRGRSPALRISAQPRHRSGSFPSNRSLDIWDGSISLASIG